MKKIYTLSDIKNINIPSKRPLLIFLKGDLGTGKTTISQHILMNILKIVEPIISPTYTYYNIYDEHYHFDLYRLEHYNEFHAIGGEEILDNNTGVILVEWPEIIENYYSPDLEIILSYGQKKEQREISILPYHV